MPSVLTNDAIEPRHKPAASAPRSLAWMAVLVLLTLLFFLSFFNRFAGLRSGNGEFTTGLWFLQGKLPFRDYFSATPPLNTLKSALLLRLFGPCLIVSRAAGVAERVLLALLLFRWLQRLFAEPYAFAGALATIIVSAGDRTDPIASYNHDAILWAMLSGLAASHLLDAVKTRLILQWSFLAGACAALSLATKQTVGLGAMVAVPLAVAALLLNARRPRPAALWLSGFSAGAALPLLLLAAWMHRLHMLRAFLDMAFLKGPAAKAGHLTDFVRRELMIAGENWLFVALALLATALSARALLRSARRSQPAGENSQTLFATLSLAFAVSILAAELLAFSRLGVFYNVSKAAVYFVFLVTGVQFAAYALLSLRVELTTRQRQLALFATVSFFIAFFLSLSWPAFEAMTLPGLGLLIAAILEGAAPRSRPWVYAAAASLIFFQVREKLALPFAFEGLNEPPVREQRQPSPLPALRGLRLAPQLNDFLQHSVQTIQAHSRPGDTLFTYPEMSLLYPLAGRDFPTFAASHNVDVVSDTLARDEAARLLANPPAFVLYRRLTPEESRREDDHWRFGRPSGQHTLVRAVEQLVAGYRTAGVYDVGDPTRTITLYIRPDR